MLSERPEKRPQHATDVLAEVGRITSRELLAVTAGCVRFTLRHGSAIQVSEWPQSFLKTVETSHLDCGRAGFLAVVGPLGSGKSTALGALKRRFQSRDDAGLTLHAAAASGDSPGGTIRRLVTQIPAVLRETLPDELKQALRSLVSDAILASAAGEDPAKSRERAIDVLSRALLWFGRESRLTLLIDDANCADGLSWDVLQLAARSMIHTPENAGATVIVVTAEQSALIDALIDELGELGGVFRPPAFDSNGVDRLISQSFLGRKPTHRLVQAVIKSCGGNPLIICEAIASAMDNGLIAFADEQIDLTGKSSKALPVPADAEHALNARVDAMNTLAQTMLVWLAHSSVAIPLKLVVKVLNLDGQAANQLIHELQESDLVQVQIDEEESSLMLAAPMVRAALKKKTALIADVHEALRGIEECSHLWIVFLFDEVPEEKVRLSVRPPRIGGNEKLGVFATRSPFRPNRIGISACRFHGIDRESGNGPALILSGMDLTNGTAVHDVKPYLPYADMIPDAWFRLAPEAPDRLPVRVAEEVGGAFANIPENQREVILETLSLDARPAFHEEQGRTYFLRIFDLVIIFTTHFDY